MSTQHTPTPYAVGTDTARDAVPGRVHVLAQSSVGTLETVAVASTPANAVFIVRACNSHDALVAECAESTRQIAALQLQRDALVAALRAVQPFVTGKRGRMDEYDAAMNLMRKALAAATE